MSKSLRAAAYDLGDLAGQGDREKWAHSAIEHLFDEVRDGHNGYAIFGHSAGGHLAACMVATDWSDIDSTVPADLTAVGAAISGLFDLTPLRSVSMNSDLRLAGEEDHVGAHVACERVDAAGQ